MDRPGNQFWKVEEVLAHCSHQAKRIKKLTRSANTFAKHTKTQGDKVQSIANEAAQAIASDFANFQFDSTCEDSEKIQFQLEELLFKSQPNISEEAVDKKLESGYLRKSKDCVESSDSRLPTLPSSLSCFVADDVSNEDVSDSGSDFFPDWSSIDSCTSSLCSFTGASSLKQAHPNKGSIFLNGEEFLGAQENEMEITVENDSRVFLDPTTENSSLRDMFNKGECTMMVIQPTPAAGNELPGTSGQAPVQKVVSSVPTDDEVKMKPSALRRVKSMVMDNDLQDSVEMGKKMFLMQQKRVLSSMSAHPSPLLTSEDVVQVKKSLSQTSATKYSLKRSRSNISAELSTSKRNNLPWYNEDRSGIMEGEESDVPMEEGYLPT